MAKLHHLQSQQFLKCDRKTVWEFMSDPGNLAVITPAYMNFTVLSGHSDPIYPGQVIQYHVSPVLGLRLNWVTEITHVKEGYYFVDEQRSGPYAFWHHQHHLEDVEGGTLMKDLVHYKAPFGLAGQLANSLFIRKQLNGIFAYRHAKLEELFNRSPYAERSPTGGVFFV